MKCYWLIGLGLSIGLILGIILGLIISSDGSYKKIISEQNDIILSQNETIYKEYDIIYKLEEDNLKQCKLIAANANLMNAYINYIRLIDPEYGWTLTKW